MDEQPSTSDLRVCLDKHDHLAFKASATEISAAENTIICIRSPIYFVRECRHCNQALVERMFFFQTELDDACLQIIRKLRVLRFGRLDGRSRQTIFGTANIAEDDNEEHPSVRALWTYDIHIAIHTGRFFCGPHTAIVKHPLFGWLVFVLVWLRGDETYII